MTLRSWFAGLCLALLTLPAFAAEVLDRIIVVVNDGVILQSELDAAVDDARRQLAQRGIRPPEEALRPQVLERLILTRIQTQRAQQAGIRVDDRELNEVLTGVAQRNGMTLGEFAAALRQDGLDYLAVREQVRDEVLVQRLRAREVESRISVTDQDVDLFLQQQGNTDNREFRLSHILVALPEGASAEQRSAARAEAEALRQRAASGADFAQLAIAHSDGQQALQGGDLDWRRPADLPSIFANAAAQLQPGQISPVLESGSGFHVLKLTDVRGGEERQTVTETRARHILLAPNAVRNDEQSRLLARDLYTRIQGGEDFAKLAKEYSDDPGSKNAGGDLGFQPPGVFAPEFQTQIDQLQPGQVSPPFRTQFGWHIASVTERRDRDTTEESRRARARQAIGNRKMAEEYDLWLRRLREEAYIEYRQPADSDAAKPS